MVTQPGVVGRALDGEIQRHFQPLRARRRHQATERGKAAQFGMDRVVPAIDGAVDACTRLHDAGFDLVCVSALDAPWQAARLRNLRDHGFPIERVIATGNHGTDVSPKAEAIAELAPEAFVDDYLPYFRGLPEHVHTALILRGPNGSPNVGDELRLARSSHSDLAAFATHWLAR